jgi:hypothetical protein
MQISAQPTAPRRFVIKPSATLVSIEIALHLFVAAGLLALPTDWFKLMLVVLFTLTSVDYFTRRSVRARMSGVCWIEVDPAKARLRFHSNGDSIEISQHDLQVRFTRWFVLLQRVDAKPTAQWLLLADSFDDPRLYSHLRRILKQIEHVG